MRHKKASFLTVALLVFGCACYSIASFDPLVVSDAGTLQQKFEVFFSGLAECAGTPEAEFARHEAFYADAWQELERLEARAQLRADNELTLRSIGHIRDNLAELEALHRLGITRAEVEIIARLFDTQFRMLVALENAKKGSEV